MDKEAFADAFITVVRELDEDDHDHMQVGAFRQIILAIVKDKSLSFTFTSDMVNDLARKIKNYPDSLNWLSIEEILDFLI